MFLQGCILSTAGDALTLAKTLLCIVPFENTP
jgi:hypothetical protein